MMARVKMTTWEWMSRVGDPSIISSMEINQQFPKSHGGAELGYDASLEA